MTRGSQTKPQYVERRELHIPVDTEIVAATRHFDPSWHNPRPTLLMYTPYHREYITYGGYEPSVTYLVDAGYNVVVADLVGTGGSSGFKREPDTMVEGKEAAAIIDWLAAQSWSADRIGMFGKSYSATTSLKAAREAPDALAAIVPIHGPHTGYREVHVGGTFQLYSMGGDWLPYMHVSQALPPLTRGLEGRWSEVWHERLDGLAREKPWLFQYLDHESKDDFWAGKDIPAEQIETPTYAVCGWRDAYPRSTIEYYEKIDAEKRLILGPWRHTMPHSGRETAVDIRRQMTGWFDHFLRDEANDVLSRPPISIWTERNGGGRIEGGVWRGLDSWPTLESVETTSFAFSADGLVEELPTTAGELERKYEYDHTVGTESMDSIYGVSKPLDTSPDDARSMTFETEPLSEPIETTGTGDVDLRVVPTTSDPLVVVRVLDVAPDGHSSLITHGALRAQHRDGFERSTTVNPNEELKLTIPLKPRSHVFEEGHRIRVAVSAGYFPLALPTRGHGSLLLRSSPTRPSRLRLPGGEHTGGVSFDDLIEMRGPDERVPLSTPRVGASDESWVTGREHLSNAASVTTSSSHTVTLPDVTMTMKTTIEANVLARDPSSASIESETDVELDYGDELVTVIGQSRVTRDAAQLSTAIDVNGHSLFDETWRWHA